MTHSRATIWLLLVLGAAAGCSPRRADESADRAVSPPLEPGPPEEPAPMMRVDSAGFVEDSPVTRGLELYQKHYCGLCHRLDRAETAGAFGPSHNGFATVAAQRIQGDAYTGSATTAADYIRESILEPDVYIVAGYEAGRFRMPAYSNLTSDELESLVELLLSEK